LWTVVTISAVNRFPKFFQKFTKFKYPLNSESDDEDEEEEEEEEEVESDDEDEEEVESDDEDDEGIPDDMRDFYEESTQTEKWKALTDSEKKNILDDELDEYMYKKK